MAKPLNILFVTSEAEPFAKTGGLGDVSSALPQMIRELGHEIRLMMPRYSSISDRKFKIHDVIRLREIPIPIGEEVKHSSINSSFISNLKIKVQVYFLSNKEYFGRDGLYISKKTNSEFKDNDERFIFFARGVLETLKRLGWQPDIIHCNDWQTGLIPAYLKTVYKDDPFFKNVKTIFTIHNLAYQGNFNSDSFEKSLLPEEIFSDENVKLNGKFSFIKSGIAFADIITTVSERYAKEISTLNKFNYGLEDFINSKKNKLYGILNGIDFNIWNPEIDPLIIKRYNSKSIDGKYANKSEVLEKFGLEDDLKTPLFGMISRLVPLKGIELIEKISDKLLKENVKLIILGSGEKKYQTVFEKIKKKYPKKVGFINAFDENLAHLVEAGSDIFLMPSECEPCGLNQMYSVRYGTIPIVRATGGLEDTIRDVSKPNGTGFKFEKYDEKELFQTILRALKLYKDQKKWQEIMRNGMLENFSWEASAKKYISLYRKLIKE